MPEEEARADSAVVPKLLEEPPSFFPFPFFHSFPVQMISNRAHQQLQHIEFAKLVSSISYFPRQDRRGRTMLPGSLSPRLPFFSFLRLSHLERLMDDFLTLLSIISAPRGPPAPRGDPSSFFPEDTHGTIHPRMDPARCPRLHTGSWISRLRPSQRMRRGLWN